MAAAESLEQMWARTHMLTLFFSWCYPGVNDEADGDRADHHVSSGYLYFSLPTHNWESEGSCPQVQHWELGCPGCWHSPVLTHLSPGGASETRAGPGELPFYAILTEGCTDRDPVGLSP